MSSWFNKRLNWYNCGDVIKTAAYSSGVLAAAIGYIHYFRNSAKTDAQTKESVQYRRKYIMLPSEEQTSFTLYTVYYPLLFQYPSTLELYYLLMAYNNTNIRQHDNQSNELYPWLLCSTLLCNIAIPFMHSQIYFKSAENAYTQHLLNCLFNKSNRTWIQSTSFKLTALLSLCEFCNLTVYPAVTLTPGFIKYDKQLPEKGATFWAKVFLFAMGCIVYEAFDVLKSVLITNAMNPPLTASDSFDMKHVKQNYYMSMLVDIEECCIGCDCASLCVEYAYGTGFMTQNDAQTTLTVVLFDIVSPFMDKSIWNKYRSAKKKERDSTLGDNIPDELKEMFNWTLCKELSKIVLRVKFDGGLNEEQKERLKKKMAEKYLKDRMTQQGVENYNMAYSFLVAVCRTPRLDYQWVVQRHFEEKYKKKR